MKRARVESFAEERFVTDGAKDVKAALARHGVSVTYLAKSCELDRVETLRILNGTRFRISVDAALDLMDAVKRTTGEVVDIRRFAHSKAVRKRLFDRRSRQGKVNHRSRAA